MTTASNRPRPVIAVAIVLFILGLNSGAQVLGDLVGWSNNTVELTIRQALCWITAWAAAAGAWMQYRWSIYLTLAHGIAVGSMLLSLPRILGLDPSAVGGLRVSALLVAALVGGMALVLQRKLPKA